MPEIAIRCNASYSIGMGHIYRQLHLAKILRRRGINVTFLVSKHPPSLQVLKKEKFSLKVTSEEEGFPKDGNEDFDAVILDLRDTQKKFILNLRHHTRKVVSFEDLGSGRNHVDLLIDANIDPKESGKVNSCVKTLFGLPYSVLAPEFSEFHQQEKCFSPTLASILVTMGGTDPNNLTLKLAEVFRNLKPELSTTFILGPGFKEKVFLQNLATETPSFNVLTNVSNMAELLFSHQAVFCSGGVTLHEAMAVGTPAFVISQVPHQLEKTRPIEKAGAAVNLGLAGNWDPVKISGSVAISKNQLESMSRKGKKLVDGRGIFRVADEIESLITT